MRLLILCEYPTLLGGERSMLATLPAVAAAGFDVHVAAPPGGPLAESLTGVSVHHVNWLTHDSRGQRLPLDELRSSLTRLIGELRPALVHANSLSTSRISGPVAPKLGIASIGHLRDIVKLAPQAIADINCHSRLLAVSHATREFHIAQGLDAARFIVIHNGVDLEKFAPRPPTGYLHRELNLPLDARLIATIGQLGLRKATDVVLTAAREIARDVTDVHWLIVGERTSNKPESLEFERQLRWVAAEPPLAGRVHFLGRRSDVHLLLNECVMLVHAARQEPLGRVLLESAASGLPVVATDVGGTREIFPTQNDGAIVVPPDDPSAIANAAFVLLKSESKRQSFANAARQRAEQAFDIRNASERLIEQYRLMLNDPTSES
jgi:glycosyltransferase involved in cell wall biosynthesis